MRLCRSLMALAAVAAVAVELPAQVSSSSTQIPIRYRSYIGLNPLGVPFDIGSIEVESGVAQGVTVGGNASFTVVDGSRWTSGDFKLRYYPGEVVLRGFSIGLSGGYLRYSSTGGLTGSRETLNAPTVGVIADYNWLLGHDKRFVVGTGVGAKRVLASEEKRDAVGMARAYSTVRFVVGLAF